MKDYDTIKLAIAVLAFLVTGVSTYFWDLEDIAVPPEGSERSTPTPYLATGVRDSTESTQRQ